MSGNSVFTDGDGRRIPGTPAPEPCPFCAAGEEDIVVEQWPGDGPGDPYHVECLQCGCEGPGGMSQIEAAHNWNRRGGSRPGGKVLRLVIDNTHNKGGSHHEHRQRHTDPADRRTPATAETAEHASSDAAAKPRAALE